jgi:ribonuclease VapC
MAILLGEPEAARFLQRLKAGERVVMAAPTKLELGMVATGKLGDACLEQLRAMLLALRIEVLDWTDALANAATDVFLRYGKRRHPAKLNFGDCMSYALAKSLDVPLLYKGDDFAKTDIRSALDV